MNTSEINKKIMGLESVTGLPVSPDAYTGDKASYIVFSWVTTSPEYFGDDHPLYDVSKLNVTLYSPMKKNISTMKKTIRDYLEGESFEVGPIWGPNPTPSGDSSKSEEIMQTVFEVEYTDQH
jgi:hypothetical protein